MASVLIADSDDARQETLRGALRYEGHRTLVATDGPGALEKALASRPALVVAEVALPGLDGFGLALSIREELDPDLVRIVLLKDDLGAEDQTTARAVGADAITTRVHGDEQVLDVLRTALATRAPRTGAVAGQVDQEALFALLQFLHQRRETGTLSVSGDRVGTLIFSRGEIIGARGQGTFGIDAFHAILALATGRYCFDRGLVDPSARSIEQAFDPLLMDAFSTLR